MNRTDRLVAIVMFMQGRRLVRADDMAAHFEVSVRTIYRDLAALGESGVPITGEAGLGYTLLKSYHLPPVMLTGEEASALFVGAEMARQYTDGSLQGPLSAALLKLRAVLPKDRQDFVDQLTRKTVILSPSHARGSAANDRQWLFPLQDAAVRRRVTRLRYRGVKHEADTVREVEPLGVVFYGGCWYLVAWCRLRQDLRHFRVDRIKEVTQLPEGFTPRPEFSLTQHLKRVAAQDEMISVRLWFAHHAMDRARRESFVPLREETSDAEGVEVVSATFSLCWLATWLLSFGGSAEALEPEELRESVRKQAQGVLERHAAGEAQLV